MARQTKLKIAALATTLVATLGVAGMSSAVSTDASHAPGHGTSMTGHEWCC